MKLSEVADGETRKIESVDADFALKTRLLHLGVSEGASVTVLRRAPTGDPIEIRLRGFCMAIRISAAEKITVV